MSDGDVDQDSITDCIDKCPFDMKKTKPSICGCATKDMDLNNDGVLNCKDSCPSDLAESEPGVCGCGGSDMDTDKDQVTDCMDQCPNDMKKTKPGICGCGTDDNDMIVLMTKIKPLLVGAAVTRWIPTWTSMAMLTAVMSAPKIGIRLKRVSAVAAL